MNDSNAGQPARASHPRSFCPGQLWPDDHGVHVNAHGGGILHHDGVYYWFGEHKIAGKEGNLAYVGVHCYRSTDLYNWADAGIALPVSSDPSSDIVAGCVIERPKVIHVSRTGKFVMWFHLELKDKGYSAALSGVAVADRPAGPYVYVGSFRPNAGAWPQGTPAELRHPLTPDEQETLSRIPMRGGPLDGYPTDRVFRRDHAGGQMARDMTLFVDDDGRAYHIYASEENGVLHISQLADDGLTSAGQYVRVFPGRFNEAPAVFKRRGRYYLMSSGCTGWAPNAARSAVADSIWGPWRELGNPCTGVNPQNGRGTDKTFGGQSTFVLPVAGRPDVFIAMFDLWRPDDAIDGRYLWLPVRFEADRFTIPWLDEWDLG